MMSAVERVLKAWTDPGPVPAYHRVAQDALRRDWPTLAAALDALAAASPDPESETR